MEEEGLWTTVVGSFPLENTKENVERTIDDQINLGIDYPCYGQLISMISQFLTPLSNIIPEFKKESNKFYLYDDFNVPEEPFALEYGQTINNFLEKHPEYKDKIRGTKACLTGPFTLASEILLKEQLTENVKPRLFNEPRAIMVDWIVEKLARVMKSIGKAYNNMGIDIISMDEPILGLLVGRKIMFHSKEFIIDILNKAISEIDGISSIHVCGRLNPNLRDLLLETEVNILDHEFQTNQENFDLFEKSHFKTNDKFLGLGVVETKIKPIENGTINDYIESIPTIKKTIEKGIKLYGKENLFIKPDCGFMPLKDAFQENMAYKIALKKLNNMVLAVKSFL